MSQALNVSDQIASVVSALIGLTTLLLARHRFRGSKRADLEHAVAGRNAGAASGPSSDAPVFLGLSRSRIAVQLGSIWLLAAALTLYGHAVDSYGTFLAGLVLMGVVIVASSLIAPAGDSRPPDSTAPGPAGQDSARGRRLIADAAAVLLLAVVGYLLALAAYQRAIPVAWLIPAFAGASAVLGLARTRRGMLASPRMVARSTGALTLGAIAALVVLYLSYGPEREWSTNRKLEGGHASGTVRKVGDDQVQVFGSVVDELKDDMSVRLYLIAQPANAPEYSVSYVASRGRDTAEPIEQDGNPGTLGHTFDHVTSIQVKVCRADYIKKTNTHVDTRCTKPLGIWRK